MSRLLFRRDKYPAVDRTSFVRYCSTAAMNTGLFLASRLDTRIFISFREHLPAEKISPVHLLTGTGTGRPEGEIAALIAAAGGSSEPFEEMKHGCVRDGCNAMPRTPSIRQC